MDDTYICSYSAPVCITLAGGKSPFEPSLMCAHEARVTVEVHASTGDLPDCLVQIARIVAQVYPAEPAISVSWNVQLPEGCPLEHTGLVSALISAYCACFLHVQEGTQASLQRIQKLAYQVEKKLLQLDSHAQTTVACMGGLVFYRKEFDFHKTVFKIPAHIPKSFLSEPELNDHTVRDTDTTIRRLVFAIMHEDEKMFVSTYDKSNSDVPDMWHLAEDSEGLRLEAKTS